MAAHCARATTGARARLPQRCFGWRPVHHTEAFRHGLSETGYVEGRNVTIEYRYADNRIEQLQSLAADLINRKVAVIIATGGNNSGLVAKSLTSTIPIVFTSGLDPVKAGLVTSLNRPEANVTGVSWFSSELGHKHIELLHELVPQAVLLALLVNPNSPEGPFYEQSAHDGARVLGRRLFVVKAGTLNEIDAAFATLAGTAGDRCARRGRSVPLHARPPDRRVGGSARASDDFFDTGAALAGGLISYGNSVTDGYRRAGILPGRLLNGARTADIPIDRATTFELVINLGTAKALDLEVPPTLLARADEVIE